MLFIQWYTHMLQAVDNYKRPADLHGLPKAITLYQYEVCPFCCKAKAALDYYKVLYRKA